RRRPGPGRRPRPDRDRRQHARAHRDARRGAPDPHLRERHRGRQPRGRVPRAHRVGRGRPGPDHAGGRTMIRLVRTELEKLRTIRQPYGMLAGAAGITAFVALIVASRSGGTGPDAAASLATAAGLTQVITATGAAMLLALAFGVAVATGEFRHG